MTFNRGDKVKLTEHALDSLYPPTRPDLKPNRQKAASKVFTVIGYSRDGRCTRVITHGYSTKTQDSYRNTFLEPALPTQAAMTPQERTSITCIICTSAIQFPEYVRQDYDGHLLCDTCRSLLQVKLKNWQVKQYRVLNDRYDDWKGKQALAKLQDMARKASMRPSKDHDPA